MTAQTFNDVRKLIRKARAVYIRPFFGVLEAWAKISKTEAYEMFAAYSHDQTLLDTLDYDQTLSIDETDGNLYLG